MTYSLLAAKFVGAPSAIKAEKTPLRPNTISHNCSPKISVNPPSI